MFADEPMTFCPVVSDSLLLSGRRVGQRDLLQLLEAASCTPVGLWGTDK